MRTEIPLHNQSTESTVPNCCLKQKNGSCSGCNILAIALNEFRWGGKVTPEEAMAEVGKVYCPENVELPSLRRHLNHNASIGMGQRNHENFSPTRGHKRKKPGSRRKISKKKTNTWYADR